MPGCSPRIACTPLRFGTHSPQASDSDGSAGRVTLETPVAANWFEGTGEHRENRQGAATHREPQQTCACWQRLAVALAHALAALQPAGARDAPSARVQMPLPRPRTRAARCTCMASPTPQSAASASSPQVRGKKRHRSGSLRRAIRLSRVTEQQTQALTL